MKRFVWLAPVVIGALALWAGAASAQYPERVIRIISPAPPGGMTDIMSRVVQPGLTELLKQTVIVESRGGAGGYIGSDYVAKSPPDGYTLLLGGVFTATTAMLQKNPNYNPRTDLTPIAIYASVPNILVAGPHFTGGGVADLIRQARAEPDKLNVGSNGVGTTIHLSSELFKMRAGAPITHVAYRGQPECVVALLSGQVDIMFDNLSSALPNIKAGKIRPLAIMAKTRSPLLPDVPTLEEAGVKNAEVTSWFGLMAPAGTPPAVIATIAGALKTISARPEFQKSIRDQGMDPQFLDTAEATKFWMAENVKWAEVIKAAGIAPQ